MNYITTAQLERDIKELPKDYNTGRPAAMVKLTKQQEARRKARMKDRLTSRQRAEIEKKIRANHRKNAPAPKAFSGKNILLSVQIQNLRVFNKAK